MKALHDQPIYLVVDIQQNGDSPSMPLSTNSRAGNNTKMIAMRERLLDAAEHRARRGGYHGFSFRDLASDVEIKSASVHYHFPTKADLAGALAERYTRNCGRRLQSIEITTAHDAISAVIELFRDALYRDDKMCLCGILGAERDGLPEAVNGEVSRFFEMLLRFLNGAFDRDWNGPSAAHCIATLEGALILARSLNDKSLFDQAVRDLWSYRNHDVPIDPSLPAS